MPDTPPGPRPLLRTAGVALLGVGVIAAAVGLFTSATSGSGAGTAVPSSSSQALPTATVAPTYPAAQAAPAPAPSLPPTAAPAAPAAPSPAPPVAAPAPAPASPPAAEPAPQAAPVPNPGPAGSAARAPLRVYNNSLIQGLAAKAKSDFESQGWTVTDISGYSGGNIAHSTAYFRPGTPEEAAAQELGKEFGLRVEPRFPGIQQSTDGVIVIVTEDYKPAAKS